VGTRFEGVRWNDIRRWHIAEQELAKQTISRHIIRVEDKNSTTNNGGGYAARYQAREDL
jgi:hypothetical protein